MSDPAAAQPFIDFLARHHEARLVDLPGPDGQTVKVFQSPSGVQITSVKKLLDEYRQEPERRTGTATLLDLASFIAYVNRYRDRNSSLFGVNDAKAPTLGCVFDHHEAMRLVKEPARTDEQGFRHPAIFDEGDQPCPRFGQHRAHYALPLSEEWRAWMAQDGEVMEQRAFAEFLEDRIVDVLDPARMQGASVVAGQDGRLTMEEIKALLGGEFADPKKLMELSRGLKIAASIQGGSVVNVSTGEIDVTYKEEHGDGTGQKLRVPGLFFIGIPVFTNGDRYKLPVRLRYRLAGSVKWSFEIWRADKALDLAFAEACDKVRAETGLPLFLGSPER